MSDVPKIELMPIDDESKHVLMNGDNIGLFIYHGSRKGTPNFYTYKWIWQPNMNLLDGISEYSFPADQLRAIADKLDELKAEKP